MRKHIESKVQNKGIMQLVVAAPILFRKIDVESIERQLWRTEELKNCQVFEHNILQLQE